MLKIGELASLAGVSRDTLRFYEKHGLIIPNQRTESGYRLYSNIDVERISFIVSAKEVGFTLNEIHQLLELEVTKDKKSCQDVKEFVDNKITIVNQRLSEIKKVKQ
ncbi:MerR family transcriptional regulator, partial [Porticoccaceae bacterium]|nr:MerR family transcriptional regulator [Porticoccaceae bacterium]